MGQAKKKRACPAVERTITPAECGEKRISEYACPESCEFNPWAGEHYSEALEIEDGAIPKVMKRLEEENSFAAPPSDLDPIDENSWWLSKLYFERDEAGRSFVERWQTAGWTGLRNDERVLVESQLSVRGTVLELREVGDAWVDVKDLLQSEAPGFRIYDRSLAAKAIRFQPLLGLTFECPHYHRLHGTAFPVPDVPGWSGDQIIESVIRHLGGTATRDGHEEWLNQNFIRVREAISEIASTRQLDMLGKSEVWTVTTGFDLKISAEEAVQRLRTAGARLDDEGAPNDESEQRITWLESPEPDTPKRSFGEVVLGALVLAPGKLQLEGHSRPGNLEMRKTTESALGDDAVFAFEREKDLAREAALELGEPSDLVPPELISDVGALETTLSRTPDADLSQYPVEERPSRLAYSDWADSPIPLFDDHTPREALRIDELRPKVIAMVKSIVRRADESARDEGLPNEVGWLVRDLDLPELDLPRPRFPEAEADFDDGAYECSGLIADELAEELLADFFSQYPTPAERER